MKILNNILAAVGALAVCAAVFLVVVGTTLVYVTHPPESARASREAAAPEPRQTEASRAAVERVAPRAAISTPAHAEQGPMAALYKEETAEPDIDPVTTAAVEPERETARTVQAPEPVLNPDHMDWCADRYRSYRPRDNAYTPYSGGRRECVSPYPTRINGSYVSGASAETGDARPYQSAEADAGYQAGFVDAGHVRSCMARYRSYRVADNSYQPYGGGPRRQCQ